MSTHEHLPILEENLTPAEQARLYKFITDKGFEYIPWVGREEEFRNSYVMLDSAPLASVVDKRFYATEDERERTREALERWDELAAADSLAWYPEQREVEKTAEALVSYYLSDFKDNDENDYILHIGKKFRRLPISIQQTLTSPTSTVKRKGFLARIFG